MNVPVKKDVERIQDINAFTSSLSRTFTFFIKSVHDIVEVNVYLFTWRQEDIAFMLSLPAIKLSL